MTTTGDQRAARVAAPVGSAEALLAGLTAQDFAKVGGAFSPGARLRALLPSGPREWHGAEVIAGLFAGWFGGTEDFELVESAIGEVGGRLHLRWRLRLRAERLGTGWFTVEQQAYADADADDRIARLDMLCTGYRRESRSG